MVFYRSSRCLKYLKADCFPYLIRRLIHSNVNGTVTTSEIEHFKKLSANWWDVNGEVKLLHSLNDIRIPFIVNGLIPDNNKNNVKSPLNGKRILDIGCGGGILTENLAKYGAQIDGIDACDTLINIAIAHATLDSNLTNLKYYNTTVEEYAVKNAEKYDAIIVSEVIEHIVPKEKFLKECLTCIKPEGSIFITTLSKTFFSWLLNIGIIQEICQNIPKGTHSWDLLISNEDTSNILKKYNCETKSVKGYCANVFTNKWFWVNNKLFCYALHGVKQ